MDRSPPVLMFRYRKSGPVLRAALFYKKTENQTQIFLHVCALAPYINSSAIWMAFNAAPFRS
jgi:hypothetical protein